MPEAHMEGQLSDKFHRLASFALIMTAIVIFFGTIYLGMHNLHISAASTNPQIKMLTGYWGDFILKGILTAIFVMMFAIVFMLNDLLRVLEKQQKSA